MHGDPLPLLGQDEAEVLRLVERKHRGIHGFAGVPEKRRLGIRPHARFRHIGQAGSAPVMLIPYPHAPQRNARSLVGASDGRPTSISERISERPSRAPYSPLSVFPTLAVELQSSARDVRGGAGPPSMKQHPLIHPGALPSVSTPTSGAFPTASRAIGCPPTSPRAATGRDHPSAKVTTPHQRLVPRGSPVHAFLNGGPSYPGFVTGVKPVPAADSRDRTIEADVTRDPVG